MKINKAVILSAGFGKRLNPLTLSVPKSLLKIGSKTLLANTIDIIEQLGITEIVISTHHLAKQIDYFILQNKFKAKVTTINENKNILDTGGGILNAISQFKNESFFVLNPDTIWSVEYLNELKKMENIFFSNDCKGVLLIVNKNRSFDKSFKGDFNLNGKIINRNAKLKKFIYTGAQILSKEAFNDHSIGTFSVNKIWDQLISKNLLLGEESMQAFLHVGTLENYKQISKRKF